MIKISWLVQYSYFEMKKAHAMIAATFNKIIKQSGTGNSKEIPPKYMQKINIRFALIAA